MTRLDQSSLMFHRSHGRRRLRCLCKPSDQRISRIQTGSAAVFHCASPYRIPQTAVPMRDQEEAVDTGRQPSQSCPNNEPDTSTQSNKHPESVANEEQSGVERPERHEMDNAASGEQAPKRRFEPLNEERELAARRRRMNPCTICRKRKINCSGDPGDGSGCIYCKRSGVGETECRFGVVGSKAVTKVKG